MTNLSIKCKYIHIYIHWGIFLNTWLASISNFKVQVVTCFVHWSSKRVLHFPLKWIYQTSGVVFVQSGTRTLYVLHHLTAVMEKSYSNTVKAQENTSWPSRSSTSNSWLKLKYLVHALKCVVQKSDNYDINICSKE